MKPQRHFIPPAEENPLNPKPKKRVPYEFVLDTLTPVVSATRSMFGCLAIYVDDQIVLALRDKPDHPADNGLWLATTSDHHESLRHDFPNMRSIKVLGSPETAWQILPADAPDFEESALHACELILRRDPRIGKVPKARTSKSRKPVKRPSR